MNKKIGVVVPSYMVKRHLLSVVESIPDFVDKIYIVDDKCPEGSGKYIAENCHDSRVFVHFHDENLGVGGAVMTGYRCAISDGMDVVVKIDGDGQMDPSLIPLFIEPILSGEADYTKGNRFYDLEEIRSMPFMRLFGNSILSLMTKFSSGYWNLFDPTNGYTAIHTNVARRLPFKKISYRYFFETDMLFRLNIIRAVVVDVPMNAKYGDEVSSLKISRIIGEFLYKHARNFFKRVFYNYYLRDLNIASIELPLGLTLLLGGIGYGSYQWYMLSKIGMVATSGTVMIASLPILMGFQLILAFLNYDIFSIPTKVIHKIKKN
jgi:glycosyltransferase involved in cell wall biosynthesis